jgi:hypothetical protein
MRVLLEGFFPKLPHYTAIMKRLPKIWFILEDALCWKPVQGNFIIDSTPIKLCLQVRANVFKTMREAVGKAVSSTKNHFRI